MKRGLILGGPVTRLRFDSVGEAAFWWRFYCSLTFAMIEDLPIPRRPRSIFDIPAIALFVDHLSLNPPSDRDLAGMVDRMRRDLARLKRPA